MVVSDRDNLTHEIQSSRKHLSPRYLEDFQNPTAPDTTGELNYHSLDSAWLPKHTPATIQALSKPDVYWPPPHPDSIQSYPRGNVNLPQPLRCEPTCVPGQTIGTTTPLFSHAEVSSSSHFSHRNNYALGQCGRVVKAPDLESGGPGFKSRSDHFLELFLGSPKFSSSASLVK